MAVSNWPLLKLIIVASLTAAIATPTPAFGFAQWPPVGRNIHQTPVQSHALCDIRNSIWAQTQQGQLKLQLCRDSCSCTQSGALDCRPPDSLRQLNQAHRCDSICRCNIISPSTVDPEPVEHFNHLLKGDEENALRQERLYRFMAEEGLDNSDDDDDGGGGGGGVDGNDEEQD